MFKLVKDKLPFPISTLSLVVPVLSWTSKSLAELLGPSLITKWVEPAVSWKKAVFGELEAITTKGEPGVDEPIPTLPLARTVNKEAPEEEATVNIGRVGKEDVP